MIGLDYRGILERAGADLDAPDGTQAHALGLLDVAVHALIESSRVLSADIEHGIAIAAFNGHVLKSDEPIRIELDRVDAALRRFKSAAPSARITEVMRGEAKGANDGR